MATGYTIYKENGEEFGGDSVFDDVMRGAVDEHPGYYIVENSSGNIIYRNHEES